jgi:hypothetical protein
MYRNSRSFTSALGAALTVLSFVFALEISREWTQPSAAAGVDAATSIVQRESRNGVNRSIKGDRQRVIVRPEAAERPEATEPFDAQVPRNPGPKARPQMLDGCESPFGPIDQSPTTRIGRCVT